MAVFVFLQIEHMTSRARAFYEADTGLPDEAWCSGHTTSNRARLGIAKTHRLNATCVGEVGTLLGRQIPSIQLTAGGRADDGPTQLRAHGFPRGHRMRTKAVCGFKTGDITPAAAPKGTQAALHVGRAAVPASDSFTVGNAGGINARLMRGDARRYFTKHCKLLHRADGYGSAWRRALPPAAAAGGLERGRLR